LKTSKRKLCSLSLSESTPAQAPAHVCRTPANRDRQGSGVPALCTRPCETVAITIDWLAKLKCDAALGPYGSEIKSPLVRSPGRQRPRRRLRWPRPTNRRPLCPSLFFHAAHRSKASFVQVFGTSVAALKRGPRSLYVRDACSNYSLAQSNVFYVTYSPSRLRNRSWRNESSESPAVICTLPLRGMSECRGKWSRSKLRIGEIVWRLDLAKIEPKSDPATEESLLKSNGQKLGKPLNDPWACHEAKLFGRDRC
jgi:hypothetical protein